LTRIALGNLEAHRRVVAFQQIPSFFSPARFDFEFYSDSLAHNSLRRRNLLWSLRETGESGTETKKKYY